MNIRCDYRLLFYLVLQGIFVRSHCSMCLTWSIENNTLILNCKIDKIISAVSIYNPHGVEQAYCLLPYPVPVCFARHKYGRIFQNITTHETIYIMNGNFKEGILGNWSCHHGTNIDMVYAFVHNGIDIDGPYIFADRESPLLASSTVNLTCLVYTDCTKYDTLELIWDCFTKSQPVSNFTNSSMVMSTLSINVLPSYHNGNCSCTAKMANFKKSTYFEFDVFEEIISQGSPRSNTMWYLIAGIIGSVIIIAVLIVTYRVFRRTTGRTSRSVIYTTTSDESNPCVYDKISPINDFRDEDDHHEFHLDID